MRSRINPQLRLRLAQESARIIAQEKLNDYRLAKQKAAARLGVHNKKLFPSNEEVTEALHEYQRLFSGQQQYQRIQAQRRAALEAMRFLEAFQPHLSGAVLHGTATESSEIQLHLFHDTHEEIACFLLEHNIPYETTQRLFQGLNESLPAYRFLAGEDNFLLIVFRFSDLHRPLVDPLDGKALRRMNSVKLANLLTQDAQHDPFCF